MRQVHLYLPTETEQDAVCLRWVHLLQQIDREFCEVRIYTQGLDFAKKDALHSLPYCIETKPNQKPKRKSFSNMWKSYMIDTGKAEDDFIPNYD